MMLSLGWILAVAVLCVRVQAKWPAEQSLDSDLDSLLCTPRNYPGVIIDIHESMDKGAKLMDGVWAKSVSACVSGCCNTRGCDLALFKNEGTSKTGKNCYYVDCGELGNCVMVQHSSFTTISFMKADTRTGDTSAGVRTGHSPASSQSPVSTEPTPPPTTATPTPPTTATPTPPTTATPTQPPAMPEATTAAERGMDSPATTLAPSNSTPLLSSEAGGVRSNASTVGPGKDGTKQNSVSGEGVLQSGGNSLDNARVASGGTDECSKYGCDGSGVVAVVVVGVVCFAIVLVVVAILLKKVVDDRRNRKFRNVDYLINGMYT